MDRGLVHDLTKDGFVLGVTDRVLRVRVHQLLLEAGARLAHAPTPRRTPPVVAVAQQAHHEVLGGRGHDRGAQPRRGRGVGRSAPPTSGRRGEVGRPAAGALLRLLGEVVAIPRKRDELPALLGDQERRRGQRPGGGRDGGSEGGG